CREDDCQRVAVEGLPDTPFSNGPGRRARFDTLFFLLGRQGPGFRRSLLPEADRQQHIHPHLAKLSFPVFECRADEMAAMQVAPQVQARAMRFPEFLVVREEAGPYLAEQEADEQQEQRYR